MNNSQSQQLYNQYQSYLSAALTNNAISTYNTLVSGKLDICKQLILIGTNNYSGTDLSGKYAVLSAGYFNNSIPKNAPVSALINYFTAQTTNTYKYLSGHYKGLDKNVNSGSDVVKLEFIKPVPTVEYVAELLSSNKDLVNVLLKTHNYWNESSKQTIWTYLNSEDYTELEQNNINLTYLWISNSRPHDELFKSVQNKIDNDIADHNISETAHANRFGSYYTKDEIDALKNYLLDLINGVDLDSKGRKTLADDDLTQVKAQLQSALNAHINSTYTDIRRNDNTDRFAHARIFDYYYTKIEADQIKNALKTDYNSLLNAHKANGVSDHTTLAPLSQPHFQKNIYLNYNALDSKAGLTIQIGQGHYGKLGIYTPADANDCNGLALKTSYNGIEPIVAEQYTNDFISVKNRAYILDKNGDTIFPNNLSVTKSISTANLTVSSIKCTGKIESNSIETGISYTDLGDLPRSDRSNIIPNTRWVHEVAVNAGNDFCVTLFSRSDNKEFQMLFPNEAEISTGDVTQRFGYTAGITVNPSKKRLTVPAIASQNITNSNTIATKYITAETVNATGAISASNFVGSTFNGVSQKAKYDQNGNQINGSVKHQITGRNQDYYLLLSDTYEEKKVPVLIGSTILVNPKTSSITATNFNGTAMNAKWADLAEKYLTDKYYDVGTLVQFGGQKQITIATTKVNAVISQNPAYLMNSGADGQPIALAGRVRVKVKGIVNKFDYIQLSDQPGIGKSVGNQYTSKSIAIALQNNTKQYNTILCCIQLHI